MNVLRLSAPLAAALVVVSGAAISASSPYVGQELRHIKALSTQDIDDLLAGNGMGYAKAAELNGYPGPRHVLELADELHLTSEQVVATKSIEATMRTEAKSLGSALVEAEKNLDTLFAARRIDETSLAAAVGEIGRLQAKLREGHLRAHLAQARLLDSEQTERYFALRGYQQHHHQ